MFRVHDLNGRPLFYVEDDSSSVARDENGKPVASRVAPSRSKDRLLSERAASMMSDRPALFGDLVPSDVATPRALVEYGIVLDGCVADRASPVTLVGHDRGYWFLENVADATNLVIDPTNAPGVSPATVDPGYAKTAFTTVGYALATKVPRLLSSNADFDLKARALRRLVEALRLQREARVANALALSTTWASGNRVAAAAKWNGGALCNPLLDLFSALSKSAMPANLLVLPESVEPYFYANSISSAVRDFVQGGGVLPSVAHARARYTSAGVLAYAWAPTTTANVALLREATEPGTIGSAATFRWLGDDLSPDSERVSGMMAREYRSPRDDADWIVVAHNDVEVVLSNQVGAIITGALAP